MHLMVEFIVALVKIYGRCPGAVYGFVVAVVKTHQLFADALVPPGLLQNRSGHDDVELNFPVRQPLPFLRG